MIMTAKSDDPYAATSSQKNDEHNSQELPTFDEIQADERLDGGPGPSQLERSGADLPPTFSDYQAEYYQSWGEDTVSHDEHLNNDGEALYRFLLSQAQIPPGFLLHCRGTHQESHTRTVTYTENGHMRTRIETDNRTVTDFDFKIDITPNLLPGYDIWTVDDLEPAYRGKMVKEIGVAESKRKVPSTDKTESEVWAKQKKRSGLAPWAGRSALERNTGTPQRSSLTLRQWADDYCASQRILKEFVLTKDVYGWDIGALEQAIRESIISSYYQGTLTVKFESKGHKVYIRPSTRLSRALSNGFIKFLLWILLIYPFIWLFKRFSSHGGGIWRVGGAAYALKKSPSPEEPAVDPRSILRKGADMNGPVYNVNNQLVGTSSHVDARPRPPPSGLKEGEWFRIWESTITGAVTSKYESSTPILFPRQVVSNRIAAQLDGY